LELDLATGGVVRQQPQALGSFGIGAFRKDATIVFRTPSPCDIYPNSSTGFQHRVHTLFLSH
jgi:hypothetical protein